MQVCASVITLCLVLCSFTVAAVQQLCINIVLQSYKYVYIISFFTKYHIVVVITVRCKKKLTFCDCNYVFVTKCNGKITGYYDRA